MQRGDQLIAKRIGEDEDSGGAGNSGDTQNAAGLSQQQCDQLGEQQQLLGKIVRVRRKKEKIELGDKKKPIDAVASVVLRPARWSDV